MLESKSARREVAGRFFQATLMKIVEVAHRLFEPEVAAKIIDQAQKRVEDEGQLIESVDVVMRWFRSEEDVLWLENFWQTSEGSRFLELSVELNMRAMLRESAPHVPVLPPGRDRERS